MSPEEKERVNDLLAGLFQAAQSLGYIIGPMAGSYITILTGSFGLCSDVFAIFTLSFALLQLIIVFIPSLSEIYKRT
jgi:MFS family permease